ncbi:MAG: glycosyl hydrolase family 28-related protein [Opitutaceae bacterium]|nr:glycosyl hydrolase family 28-related protein [Opitutaceae bacterium]
MKHFLAIFTFGFLPLMSSAASTDGATSSASIIVSTIAALKAVPVSGLITGCKADVLGYNAAGDGGGGAFYYDPASGAPDNGGTVIHPAIGPGRWLRLFSGPINVRWFGAYGDGIHDDYTVIMATITAARTNGTVYFPRGVYAVGTTIQITDTLAAPKSLTFLGDGLKETYIFHTGTEATGCMVWTGQPVNAGGPGGLYIATITGSHRIKDICLGSVNGPCLTLNWCCNTTLENILWSCTGSSFPSLLIQNSLILHCYNLGELHGNQEVPSGVVLPGPTGVGGWKPTYGRNAIRITVDKSYTDGVNGYCWGVASEIFFFGCRTDGCYNENGIVIEPANAAGSFQGANEIARIYFIGCKLTASNNAYNPAHDADGVLYINGAKQVYILNSFIEAQLASNRTITIDNQLGPTQLILDNVEDGSNGYLDVGAYGGTPGPFLMHLSVHNGKFGDIRANYATSVYGSINIDKTAFITSPVSTAIPVFQRYANELEFNGNRTVVDAVGTVTPLPNFSSAPNTLAAGMNNQVPAPTAIRTGTAVLIAGMARVSDHATTARTHIRLSCLTPAGTPGAVYISAKTTGSGFLIKSTSSSDTSTVFYEASEP